MKTPLLVAVPLGVVTAIGPVEAIEDTIAVMVVALTTENNSAGDPLNVTTVAPVRLVPVMVIVASILPLVGVNEVMVGAGVVETKVNVPLLIAVPPGVVTVMMPVVPLPTVALIEVALRTVKEPAVVPPKVTCVAPVKLAPIRDTTTPVMPLVGVNEVMVGAGTKVKAPLLVAMPPGVVTVILPVAPFPTVALIAVALVTVKEVATVPPTATAVTPVKFAPVIVRGVPAPPIVGLKEVMVGAGRYVNVLLLVAVPPGVVIVIVPVAPFPTVALAEVLLMTVKDVAGVPPKATAVTPVKLAPVIVTTVPVPPLVGVNEVMVGAMVTVKVLLLFAVPPGVVTEMAPVVPLPSVALIDVALTTVKAVACTPPKATTVVPVKFVPVSDTTVPVFPLDGVNAVIVGAGK